MSEMKEERYVNVKVYDVPESTLEEFKTFAKAYAGGKYSEAIRLLLDRSSVLEIYSNIEKRLKRVEETVFPSEPTKEEEESKGPKTFGGGKR